MLSNSAFLDNSRRESRKRRRLSERRRVFSRLAGATGDHGDHGDSLGGASFSQSRDRRRSSLFKREQAPAQLDDETPAFLVATGDQGKISMKIQLHITVAPENEPLLLEAHQLGANSPSTPDSPGAQSGGGGGGSSKSLAQRQQSSDSSSAIGEHINERLNRQNSSTRRRQQLLAMHQQSALDKQQRREQQQQQQQGQQQQQQPQQVQNIQSEDNLTFVRSGSMSEREPAGRLAPDSACLLALGRENGARSSTISGGMQDEATMQFLARHQQQQQLRHANTSASLTSTGSLLGQHQTLMASANNMRHRQEQREHIFFKRDGQRFGHEFTLKLAVDKSYRCLLKVRPLIPLEALSIQGHHVAFVDCSGQSSFSSTNSSSSGVGSSLSSSAPASSFTLATGAPTERHLSQGNILNGPRHNSIAAPTTINHHLASNLRLAAGGSQNQHPLGKQMPTGNRISQQEQQSHSHARRLNHAQTTIGSELMRRSSILNSDLNSSNKLDESSGGSNLSLTVNSSAHANARLQQQLLKQHQQSQMMRHFSNSSSVSSSHLAGQLVYMFDWSAGRFEVNKNKARTQLQTVLKFRNGQILSLPLQVKFYQPECRQHLSWGSQLHFIDYDCNIDSMGQMNVDRIQYY